VHGIYDGAIYARRCIQHIQHAPPAAANHSDTPPQPKPPPVPGCCTPRRSKRAQPPWKEGSSAWRKEHSACLRVRSKWRRRLPWCRRRSRCVVVAVRGRASDYYWVTGQGCFLCSLCPLCRALARTSHTPPPYLGSCILSPPTTPPHATFKSSFHQELAAAAAVGPMMGEATQSALLHILQPACYSSLGTTQHSPPTHTQTISVTRRHWRLPTAPMPSTRG